MREDGGAELRARARSSARLAVCWPPGVVGVGLEGEGEGVEGVGGGVPERSPEPVAAAAEEDDGVVAGGAVVFLESINVSC